MKKHTLIFIGVSLILLTGYKVQSQNAKDIEALKAYIEQSRQLFEVPGIAVAIIKDGKLVLNEGFGYNNMETMVPTGPGSIFGIASCSKAMTTACLAMLVEDSLISWDDRVIDHYPEFSMSDPCITNEMRVQDLVSHRSGLETFDGDLLWYGTNYSRKEVVERIRYRPVTYSFRSQYGYQNVMFIAAGELIQKVTGKSWDEFLSERIFSPLGMTSSSTTNKGFTEKMDLAYPHVDGKPMGFLNYDNCGPAASVNTSTQDMIKWVETLLHKGTYNDQKLFSESQYYKMTSPHTLINAGPGETVGGTHFFAYGLGWFMFDFQGRKVIQHGGGLPGFHSKVVLVPEDNLGYVILANQLSGLVEAVYKKILDFYLAEDDKDWADRYHKNQLIMDTIAKETVRIKEQARLKDTHPSFDYQSYAGVYADTMYGMAEIKVLNKKLHVTLLPASDLFHSDMEHWENDSFKITFNDPFLPSGYINFSVEAGQGVNGFTIDLENPDFHFYKLHFRKID